MYIIEKRYVDEDYNETNIVTLGKEFDSEYFDSTISRFVEQDAANEGYTDNFNVSFLMDGTVCVTLFNADNCNIDYYVKKKG